MVRREKKDEFDQKLLEIARVSRVTKGGKRMSFRAVMAVGNRRGKVGVGVGKGADVSLAIEKSVRDAKKRLIQVPIVNNTIAHEVRAKYIASKIFIKPAPSGSGLIAGGVTRSIAELTGIKSISAKSLGSSNKLNCARAVLMAFQKLPKGKDQPIAPVKKVNEAKGEVKAKSPVPAKEEAKTQKKTKDKPKK